MLHSVIFTQLIFLFILDVVMFEQSAKKLAAFYFVDVEFYWVRKFRRNHAVIKRLMRAAVVVKLKMLRHNPIELPKKKKDKGV